MRGKKQTASQAARQDADFTNEPATMPPDSAYGQPEQNPNIFERVCMNVRGNIKKTIGFALIAIILGAGLGMSGGMFENVPAGYICVIQSPIAGDLEVYTTPGIKLQKFGKVTYYPRAGIFEFLQIVDPEDPTQNKYYDPKLDDSIKITFNDGGSGWISGSIRYDYPMEPEKIIHLHKIFSSHEAVLKGLVEKTVERSIYMSGPLMSSIDSAMTRKADLPMFIEDQARNGLMQVRTQEVVVTDELTNETKRVKIAEPIHDINAPNGYARQEESVLSKYGLSLSNFAMNNVSYDQGVRQRISALFDAQSDIQISMLNLRKAEQDRKTAEERGKAEATTAEWRAKAIAAEEIAAAEKVAAIQIIEAGRDKAVAITHATKSVEVAELDKQTAALYKDATLLRAEADSEARRKLMDADGALTQKLEAYKYVSEVFANAMGKYSGSWVPQVVAGGGDYSQQNAALDMMNFLTIKAARDLALDIAHK